MKPFLLILVVMLVLPAFSLFAQATATGAPDSTKILPEPEEFIVMTEARFDTTELYSHLEYSREAIQNGVEARVTIHVFINKKGHPTKAEAEKDDDAALAAAAIRAIQQTSFSPAIQNGETVGVWMTIPVTFKPD